MIRLASMTQGTIRKEFEEFKEFKKRSQEERRAKRLHDDPACFELVVVISNRYRRK